MSQRQLTLATLAVAALTLGVLALDTPLLLTCAGFFVLMAVQAFIFGNASALAAGQARQVAGAASAVLGVAQAVATPRYRQGRDERLGSTINLTIREALRHHPYQKRSMIRLEKVDSLPISTSRPTALA